MENKIPCITDDEIKKALECCIAPKCAECPIFTIVEVKKVPGRCFDGNAGSLLEKIRNFQPWNKKERNNTNLDKTKSTSPDEMAEYNEAAKNLIEAMFNFALETDMTERDAFYALTEVGIEKEDFDKAGYGEYVQRFYDEEEEEE